MLLLMQDTINEEMWFREYKKSMPLFIYSHFYGRAWYNLGSVYISKVLFFLMPYSFIKLTPDLLCLSSEKLMG